MTLLHFFECSQCPGKTCHMQIESSGDLIVPGGPAVCLIGYDIQGKRTASTTRRQSWRRVETREVSDDDTD